MPLSPFDKAAEACGYIRARLGQASPRIAIVLGSGLARAASSALIDSQIPYSEIPHFLRATVPGHSGALLVGSWSSVEVAIMSGRFHYYEGHCLADLTLPVRVFHLLGVDTLILTNASGGIAPHLVPGSFMLLTDHINLMGENPLRGPNDERFGPRFPDMSSVYYPPYLEIAHEVARSQGQALYEGVYAALAGPTYETPAEIRMLKTLGADAVGMSTVPEAIVARHCGMKTLAISCITNPAAGLTKHKISHDEVMEIGSRAAMRLGQLLGGVIPKLIVAGEP